MIKKVWIAKRPKTNNNVKMVTLDKNSDIKEGDYVEITKVRDADAK